MNGRGLAALFTVVAVVLLVPAGVAGQPAAADTPRTPWGEPDLQGVWDFRSLTPMERPEDLADQERFTTEEAATFSEAVIRRESRPG